MRANVRRAVYKRQGRYSPATAILLPNAPADLRGWLTARLGPLDSLTIEDVTPPRAQRESAPETPRSSGAADCAADLVARFRLVAATPPAPFCPRPIQAEVVTWRPPRPGSLAFSRPLARWGVPFQHAAE